MQIRMTLSVPSKTSHPFFIHTLAVVLTAPGQTLHQRHQKSWSLSSACGTGPNSLERDIEAPGLAVAEVGLFVVVPYGIRVGSTAISPNSFELGQTVMPFKPARHLGPSPPGAVLAQRQLASHLKFDLPGWNGFALP